METKPQHRARVTGLSGNEIFCLKLKGMGPGNLVIGNSVVSMGVLGGVGSGLRSLMGGEVSQITRLIHEGRERSFERLEAEARNHGGAGITGVTSDLVLHPGTAEFLSVGSCVHRLDSVDPETLAFSTSTDGQDLFCQLDCGFEPKKFVFGNVAYSVGLGGGLLGGLRSFARGEVVEFSEIFNQTRNLALQRIKAQAIHAGANAIVGIETSILELFGVQEMLMIGTASHHPSLEAFAQNPVTSDLTLEEMWNLQHQGYVPLQLVMGASVFSVGLAGGIVAAFQSLVRTEIGTLTSLIYEARESALSRIHQHAAQCGADEVVGVRTYVYNLGGGLIEFLAIGTAVRKVNGLTTISQQLPAQAIIVDRDTFVNTIDRSSMGLNRTAGSQRPLMRSGAALLIGLFAAMYAAFIAFMILTHLHPTH